MPVDLKGKGRGSRDRELELRRSKGEASCAECRRLKLKCDRRNPCTSCVRRGCQTICPNGSLSAGQGTRFVLANTDKLHAKLLEMSQRIRQLEDALQIAYLCSSQKRHPLLSEDLLKIKSGVDLIEEDTNNSNGDTSGTRPSLFDNDISAVSSEFGTLSISEKGDTCFVGRSSPEALLLLINDSTRNSAGPCYTNGVPGQLKLLSEGFPFTPVNLPKNDIYRLIEARLPSYARATTLIEAYFGNLAWFTCIVEREQIMGELMPTIYKNRRFGSPPANNPPHRFSDSSTFEDDESFDGEYGARLPLLLAVFALGAAGDLTQPFGNEEGDLYHHMSRAALALRPVFRGASMETVQAVMMSATYPFCAGRAVSLEPAWKMMSLGLILACSIGLHRDPARWNVDPKIVQRWRRLFWDILFLDKWKSLESGRPAIFNLEEVDCEFPEDRDATLTDDGTIIPGFQRWKNRFTKEVIGPIAQQMCLARVIKYSEILEFDRKLREFETHPSLLKAKFDSDGNRLLLAGRYNWGIIREVALLFVHRAGFARALLDTSVKPINSPFASSLLSAYASAVTLLKIVKIYFERNPDLVLRKWTIWAHTLIAAVIVGSVACRGPFSITAGASLKELESAVELFKAAQCHPVARQGLPFLQQLLTKAELANSPIPKDVGSAREELKIIGGATLLLNRARKSPQYGTGPVSHATHDPRTNSTQANVARLLSLGSTPSAPPTSHMQSSDFAWAYQTPTQLSTMISHDSIFYNPPSTMNEQEENSPSSHSSGQTSENSPTNPLETFAPVPPIIDPFGVVPPVDPFPGGNTSSGMETELESTSWLEQLSSNMANHLGSNVNNNNTWNGTSVADFTLSLGDENSYGAYTSPDVFNFMAEEDAAALSETWNTLMGDPKLFDGISNIQ